MGKGQGLVNASDATGKLFEEPATETMRPWLEERLLNVQIKPECC